MFFRRGSIKSHLSDQGLIQKYKTTKEPVYVAELYQRYTHLVYGVCLKYLKDEEDAKDAAMQIFEKLLQALKKQEVTKFQNWLHVLVRNYCLMVLRNRKTQKSKALLLQAELTQENDTISPEDDNYETRLTLLENGLEHLPQEQRICIELFYLQKKCYQEISQITGYDLNKVKSYIQNGKRNLKIYLEKHHDQS